VVSPGAIDLLGRDVHRRSEELATVRQALLSERQGEAEIRDAWRSRAVQQDVLGLEVAVDDPRGVRGEALRTSAGRCREPSGAPPPRRAGYEVPALHVLHGHEPDSQRPPMSYAENVPGPPGSRGRPPPETLQRPGR
jgi:hypothetical protein